MTITETDISTIISYIKPLLGQKAWGVSLGVGSFITLEFGQEIPPKNEHQKTHGEWHLWIYCCAWRIEEKDEVLAASEDSQPQREMAVQRLEGLSLHSIEILRPAWDTIFRFEQDIIVRSFSIYSQEYEHWMLYSPNHYVLCLGPGTSWSYESSN